MLYTHFNVDTTRYTFVRRVRTRVSLSRDREFSSSNIPNANLIRALRTGIRERQKDKKKKKTIEQSLSVCLWLTFYFRKKKKKRNKISSSSVAFTTCLDVARLGKLSSPRRRRLSGSRRNKVFFFFHLSSSLSLSSWLLVRGRHATVVILAGRRGVVRRQTVGGREQRC